MRQSGCKYTKVLNFAPHKDFFYQGRAYTRDATFRYLSRLPEEIPSGNGRGVIFFSNMAIYSGVGAFKKKNKMATFDLNSLLVQHSNNFLSDVKFAHARYSTQVALTIKMFQWWKDNYENQVMSLGQTYWFKGKECILQRADFRGDFCFGFAPCSSGDDIGAGAGCIALVGFTND